MNFIGLGFGILLALTCLLWAKRALAVRSQECDGIRRSEEKYRVLFELSPKPMYVFDLATFHFLAVNEAAVTHYGYTRNEFMAMTANDIRPLEEIALLFQRATSGIQTECATRHKKKDGAIIDVGVSVHHFTLDGKPSVLVSVNDITAQKRAEDSLNRAHEDLAKSVMELSQRESDLTQLQTMAEMLQTCQTPDEAYSMVSQLLPPLFPDYTGRLYVLKASRDVVESVAGWGDSTEESTHFSPNDCWALRRGNTYRVDAGGGPKCKHVLHSASSLCIPMMAQNDALGVLCITPRIAEDEAGETGAPLSTSMQNLAKTAADQTALAISNIRFRETLQNQSIRDPLTKLFNRRYLEESLDRELQRARRTETPLVVVMLDIDHFKRFNDTYGHKVGDRMLCQVARYLQTSFRMDDIVCRYGGEEFVLILPSSNVDDTLRRIEHMQEDVRQIRLTAGGQEVGGLELSAGVAVFPGNGTNADEMLASADSALYAAKHAGRNRIVIATENSLALQII